MKSSSGARHLVLATVSFAVCFAGWGLISASAPRFRELFSLSGTQTSLMIAVPVLLGSLGRLPVGLLADRFGGRRVFTVLMLLLVVWGAVFGLLARDAPAPSKKTSGMARVLRERLAWVLSLFYFLTFGGFVAFAIYLPTLLRDEFGLPPRW